MSRWCTSRAHWTDPAFASYVASLEELAEAALAQEADDALDEVVGALLAHEVAFWDHGRTERRVSLARRLWVDSAELAGRALAHPFVRGIADGSLPREVFSGYVAQDAYFLEAFARAYALALAASPDTETVLAFAGLIAGVRDELSMHAAYAARWGVDPSTSSPSEATLTYTEFLLATAATATVGLVCAAMTPCMRLYAHLGQSLAVEGVAADSSYGSWVAAYADPAFGILADQLEALLDAHATDTTAVRAAYGRAMRLELAFFDAAYTPDAAPASVTSAWQSDPHSGH